MQLILGPHLENHCHTQVKFTTALASIWLPFAYHSPSHHFTPPPPNSNSNIVSLYLEHFRHCHNPCLHNLAKSISFPGHMSLLCSAFPYSPSIVMMITQHCSSLFYAFFWLFSSVSPRNLALQGPYLTFFCISDHSQQCLRRMAAGYILNLCLI